TGARRGAKYSYSRLRLAIGLGLAAWARARHAQLRRLRVCHSAVRAGDARARIAASVGPMELVLPTLPHLASVVRQGVAGWPVRPRIVIEQEEKWTAFRSARAALAASGTVTLEL